MCSGENSNKVILDKAGLPAGKNGTKTVTGKKFQKKLHYTINKGYSNELNYSIRRCQNKGFTRKIGNKETNCITPPNRVLK